MKEKFNLNSRIFDEAKGNKTSGAIFALISPVIILVGAGVITNVVIQLIFNFVKDIKFIQAYMNQIVLILSTGISIGICFIIVKLKEKRSIKSMGFPFNKKAIIDYLEGFGLGIAMIGIAWLVIVLFGNVIFEVKIGNLKNIEFLGPFLLMTIAWLVQGASEEIMMRGYMLPVLGVKLTPKAGIIISSLFFSALHLANSGVTVISLINLSLFGIFAAFYAIKNENLWGICALHSAWNFAQQNIFGTLVSGGIVYNCSFIETTYLENNIINGGSFGPEGGIIVTGILVIAITVQILFLKKKN
ncbi:MAG: CPBP family intramembrane glutamic endopeptidase [Clostridium sp.]|uniref:CPBP family intramembrane glutamic endopeptidase n=1 Tax=Clostridium sp. TaxID=1506 RepID=UPI003F404005